MTVPTPRVVAIEGGASRKNGLTLIEAAAQQREKVGEEQRKLDVLTDEIRSLYGPGKYEEGDFVIHVVETRTLDKAKAAKLYPETGYQELVYTPASLRAKLSGEQYKELEKVGKSKVTFERVDKDA